MESNVLDKKALNNYIVSMRNDVRRSVVHTIHCLTRQARQLREKKGTEEQKAKNIKKADRLIHEVMVIKELNRDDVSKFGLITAQDLKQLQGDMKAPLQDRAKARLCLHKFIAREIEEFKKKYPVSQTEVLKILRRKKKNLKKIKPSVPEKDISNVEIKRDKSNKKKHSKLKDYDCEHNEDNEIIEENESHEESDVESVYSEEEEVGMKSETENEKDEEDYFSMSDNYDESISGNEECNKKNVTGNNKSKVVDMKMSLKKDSNIKKENSNTLKNNTGEDLMVSNNSKKEKNALKFTDLETNNTTLKRKQKTLKDTGETKAVDPFFMTIENKEYVTSQVTGNSTEDRNPIEFHSFKDNNFGRQQFKESTKSSLANDRHMEKYGFFAKANGLGDGFKNRRERRLNLHKNIDKPKTNKDFPSFNKRSNNLVVQRGMNSKPVEKLHPSWEAKKKLINIVEFQGKKITFD